MVVSQKYNVVDLEKGTLDRSVFTDERIYQDELEQIFGRAWLMIGHDSLVPNPNDFFLSYMGEDPVIITRDIKSGLHVFLNMCRHRGNRVVRADDGNAKNFMCTYHGWTFSNEGRLVSVPGLQEAYYGELDVEHLSLVEARVDTYAGIIFANWDEEAPGLEAYLGDARYYTDVRYNRRDIGSQAIGPVKWPLPVNWKTPVDNAADNYHGPTSHFSSYLVQARYLGRHTVNNLQKILTNPGRHLTVNGHGLTLGIVDENQPFRFTQAVTDRDNNVWEKFHRDTMPEVERRLGSFRARKFTLGNHGFFPNTFLSLRFALPRGPFKTEAWSFVLWEKDAPDEIVKALRLLMEQKDNLSGVHEQDDTDNWRQMTDSGRSPRARHYLSNINMGVRHAGSDPKWKGGVVADQFVSESNQRQYYSRWQEFMNARSWKDIHIDPITLPFEGTATMRS